MSSRSRSMAFGAFAGLAIAVAALFFYEQLIGVSSSTTASMLTKQQWAAQDANWAHPDNTWNKLSIALAEMQQNITATVLNAMTSASANEDAPWAGHKTPKAPSFRHTMAQFPWAEAVGALDNEDPKSFVYFQQLLDELVPYLIMPPAEVEDTDCQLPLLADSPVACGQYPKAFTGAARKKPAKVAHILQLGFDADVLEIQVNELDRVVDKIFIMESTRTHNKNLRKPLLWDRLKSQPRFRRFGDKIVHMVLDDVDALEASQGDMWGLEHLQEQARWETFVTWNNRTGGSFGPDDLVGFGDADEIPSASNVNLLKHCEMAGPSVDIGAWFAWGRLDKAFKGDWPVPDHPWTLGDPTYWTLRSAAQFARDVQFPSRMRGLSRKYLLGGVHMSDNPYVPFILAKTIACTECGKEGHTALRELGKCFIEGVCHGLKDEELIPKLLQILDRSSSLADRVKDIDAVKTELGDAYYVPWYLQCNPDKFPGWFGKADTRLLRRPRMNHDETSS